MKYIKIIFFYLLTIAAFYFVFYYANQETDSNFSLQDIVFVSFACGLITPLTFADNQLNKKLDKQIEEKYTLLIDNANSKKELKNILKDLRQISTIYKNKKAYDRIIDKILNKIDELK